MLRFQVEIGVDECLLDDAVPLTMAEEGTSPLVTTGQMDAEKSDISPQPPATASSAAPSPHTPAWASAENLEVLREMAASFNGCDLKKTASNLVFADGNPSSEIMLIGEAPGADEDRQGKPFVGVSGQLLDKMLASIHLDRGHVYITNILPWRPPGNRTPTPEEVAMFLPMIKQHIALVAPKMIITLGGASTKALCQTNEGILKLRGQWHLYEDAEMRIPIMAMLHPAYLLRTPTQKSLAWKDLRQLHHKAHELNLKYLDQSR